MTKKFNPFGDNLTAAQLGEAVRDSAQQIWLAGLGAFAKAQEEGTKVFDTLVKEGVGLQRKTQDTAEDKLSEAASRMGSMASGLGARAAGQWDKLENIFEDRVAKALKKLDVPTASDLEQLSARIDALTRALEQHAASAKGTTKAGGRAGRKSAATAAEPQPALAKRTPRKRAPRSAD
ncbi:phasin family protein [Pseudorhodoferax sp. Leaf267]|uniref:phasin family protein n=1 Tax=Pseudorhodoferax sp. Leaf267 TaxID=1736316 RepID=UPI0006FC42F1|nr:phasin family protein [Pseudorhodoferax sp. Leaf267]KQP13569.1 hypothetical protein ASF43_16775 [Pseudorhodoferax sp. Leaf267]